MKANKAVTEKVLETWVEPEIVEMSAQCSAALTRRGTDRAPGVNYRLS